MRKLANKFLTWFYQTKIFIFIRCYFFGKHRVEVTGKLKVSNLIDTYYFKCKYCNYSDQKTLSRFEANKFLKHYTGQKPKH